MQQIADWLKKLGMSEYAQRFAENDIDMAVLPDLTDQHLKDLGVSLGHRLKILRAIRDLGGASVAVTASSAPVATEPTRQDDAERRQLTVMFTDLVGSTALSTKLDPEDMRSVIGAYHKCVAETIAPFDGFVAKYMGDGVLVYFGYPHAHEDDAERAVRAGLALIDAVGKLRVQAPLQVRIGVATGVVVVGDIVGSGEAQERGVVGETPNLAARLQGIAQPNTVIVAEGTRRLLGNLFELQDLGSKDLKGIAGPARAWAVVRARSVESRFEALHTSGLTALVGREEELELLLRRWSKAKFGEGQVVLIGGEARIGKSRLTAALMERLGGEPHTRLRYFCSPQQTDSALYPIIGHAYPTSAACVCGAAIWLTGVGAAKPIVSAKAPGANARCCQMRISRTWSRSLVRRGARAIRCTLRSMSFVRLAMRCRSLCSEPATIHRATHAADAVVTICVVYLRGAAHGEIQQEWLEIERDQARKRLRTLWPLWRQVVEISCFDVLGRMARPEHGPVS